MDPVYIGEHQTLGDVLEDAADVPEQFFVGDDELPKWEFLKGRKSLSRVSKATGLVYTYDEGAIPFPDPTDTPSRTILTGEGGATPSRFKHLIRTEDGRFRRLTPRELERLNGFPGDWTVGMSDGRRAFMMGNALVVGAVEMVANELITDVVGHRRGRCESSRRGELSRPMSGRQLPNPPASSPAVRNVMRANRARDTGPELKLRRALRAADLAGYRVNWRKAPGRPDIAYPGRRIAIFVHGCYWHHCPRCYPNLPKSNPEFWERKFELNRERDARKRDDLERVGWVVIETWECDVRDRLELVTAAVSAARGARG